MSQPTSREEQRDRLLEATLVHVPFDGWSRRALLAGAADLGLEPGTAHRLFPRAGDDMLGHVERWADRQMLARVGPLEGMRVRDRIGRLVRTRLDVLGPHREAMRRATAARMLPSNGFAACGSLWRTVDLMWSAAGDDARDASYYTKRSLLAAVWASTFLFWLEDRSDGFRDTWAFLDRRIDNVMQIGRLRARFDELFQGLGRLNPMAHRR
jgi:ubiquinone biosynthesis protein COQ9